LATRKRTSKTSRKKAKVEDRLESEDLSEDLEESDEELDPEVLVGEVVSEEESALVKARLSEEEEGDKKPARSDRTELIKRDPLSAYVQETRRYPLLSREEEHELAVKLVETGDANAARRLVEANLRLVVKIAYEYRRAHRNLLDLVQEGNVGLMQAVAKYDPYRGVKLSSYAAWWIRAYMLKFILNNWRLVKIGTTQAQRKLFFNLKKEREKLEQQGFTPDSKLLAERLDVREKDVVEMEKRLAAPDASFDAPVGGTDGESVRTRHDIMSSSDSARPDLAFEESEFQTLLKSKLAAFADTLEGREETIFRDRWLTDEPKTLQQIGDQYGVSRERARQIEKRMLGRLRSYLEAELGSAVDIDALGRD
jgi:RNA polymerase sigma-32 factor